MAKINPQFEHALAVARYFEQRGWTWPERKELFHLTMTLRFSSEEIITALSVCPPDVTYPLHYIIARHLRPNGEMGSTLLEKVAYQLREDAWVREAQDYKLQEEDWLSKVLDTRE